MAEEEKEEKQKDPKKLKKLILFGFIGLNLACIGVGAGLTYVATLGGEPVLITEESLQDELEKSREDREAGPIVYTMDPFTVNLAGRPRRIIRLIVNLGMLDDGGFEEVVTLGPEARDAVVGILQNKSFTHIESIQGKLFLKDQIATSINGFLDNGVVKDVYFSQFVVQ